MTRILCATCAVAALACGSTTTTTELQGNARIDALFSVPATSVSCIRLVASGMMKSVPKDFAVTPGQSTVSLAMNGIPTGTVMFSGNAYAQACASVQTSTVPSWFADDKTVEVVPGTTATVTLNFHANGNATVSGNFIPDSFTVTTLVGGLGGPQAVAFDGNNTLYVADAVTANGAFSGMAIRSIDVTAAGATLRAGSVTALGTSDGDGSTARFSLLRGITFSAGTLYIADGCAIRTMATTPPFTVATPFPNANCAGPGAIFDIAVHGEGNDLYVTDPVKFLVWKVTGSPLTAIAVAGNGTSGTTDAALLSAQFLGPQAVVFSDASDNFLVADSGSLDGTNFFGLLRSVSSTAVLTFAGNPHMGTMMDGLRLNAFFPAPRRMVSDGISVFIADQNAVRRYDIATGAVVTVAASLNGASGIARNSASKALYVADTGGKAIRVLTP